MSAVVGDVLREPQLDLVRRRRAAAARHGGRRPPAGARCWSRRRPPRGACAPRYRRVRRCSRCAPPDPRWDWACARLTPTVPTSPRPRGPRDRHDGRCGPSPPGSCCWTSCCWGSSAWSSTAANRPARGPIPRSGKARRRVAPWLRPRSTPPASGWSSPTPPTPGQRFRCDLTWLTSSWTCIFGSGCQGIYADRPDDGCCTLGAHFTDEDDVKRVKAVVKELGEDEWQHHPGSTKVSRLDRDRGRRRSRPRSSTAPASSSTARASRPAPAARCTSTRCSPARSRTPSSPTSAGSCRSGAPTARSSCPTGRRGWRSRITEYDRRGWGPGGHDLDWYCSATPRRTSAASRSSAATAASCVELMGEDAYAELEIRCEAHLASVKAARNAYSRKMLPLLVHPATLAAQERPQAPVTRVDQARTSRPAARTSGTPPTSTRSRTSASTGPASSRRRWPPCTPSPAPTWSTSGCGTGFHLPRFADAGLRRASSGVEPHPPLVELARDRVAGLARVRVEEGIAQSLPLAGRHRGRRARPVGLLLRRRVRAGPGRARAGAAARRHGIRHRQRRHPLDVRPLVRPGLPGLRPARGGTVLGAVRAGRANGSTIRWDFDTRADLEAVVRIEFPETAAEGILAEHEGTGVDYAVNLWWRRF